MPQPRKKWSLRRWRRRWNDRIAAASLRSRIWFDRHILSYETRRKWARRFKRRSDRVGRAVESVGFKVLPHKPDAAPDTKWTRFGKKFDKFVDERVYPPELRAQHLRLFLKWWNEFTSPIHHSNAKVRGAIDSYLMPVLTPAGFQKKLVNWRGAAALCALIALVCFVPFWLLPHWRLHNNQKWSAQARLLLGRGYMALAYQNAVRVWQRDSENEAAGRVIADMLERQGAPDSMYWRRKVIEIAPTLTNRLELAATAIKFESAPCPTASRVLAETSVAGNGMHQYHVTASQLQSRLGNWPAAETELIKALAIEPENAETKLSLALTRVQTREKEKVAAAELMLQELGTQTNVTVRAWRALISIALSRSDLDMALDYSKRILLAEGSTFEDRLAHLEVLTRKREPNREKFLRLLQEQVSSNPLYVAQLCSWMADHQEAADALAWIKDLRPAIRTADPVLVATADSYAAQSDWHGLEKFLLDHPWGTIEFLRQTMLARAYRGLGDRKAFESNFGRAAELASGMASRLANLTRQIVIWRWDQETEELLLLMVDRYPSETWAAASLERLYMQRGETDGLCRLFTRQLAMKQTAKAPDDFYLMNNVAMTSLLCRRELPTAHKLALRAHKGSPESAVNAATYAYSLHVQGKTPEARKVLEALGAETLKVPGIAAYYAIILNSLGDKEAAGKYLEYAKPATLLPEEKAMLKAVRENL